MASALVLTLPQLVDLALNTPDIGTVNFTVLHALLHVMIHQLKIEDTHVEFTGNDSERLQNLLCSSKSDGGYTVSLTQYTVEGPAEEGKSKQDESKKEIDGKDDNQKEKGKQDENQNEKRRESQGASVVLVESSRTSNQFSMALNKDYFEKLNNDILELKQKVEDLTALPGDPKLIEALQSDEKTPVLDMYQNLSLSKRLDAAETMLTKLLTMLEEILRGSTRSSIASADQSEIQGKIEKLRETIERPSLPSILGTLEQRIDEIEKVIYSGDKPDSDGNVAHPDSSEQTKKGKSESTSAPTAALPDSGEQSKKGKSGSISGPLVTSPASSEQTKKKSGSAAKPLVLGEGLTIDKLDVSKMSPKDAVQALQKFIIDLTNSVNEMQSLKTLLDTDIDAQSPDVQVKHLEIKLQETEEQISSLDNGFSRQVGALTNRLADVETEVGEILERLHIVSGGKEGDMLEGNVVTEIQENVWMLQENFSKLSEHFRQLADALKDGQHTHDVLIEQLELLKIIKADKEDLEDALADKADTCTINRKVSYEQFDQACTDMSKSIENALGKLSEQEKLWNNALVEIQAHVENKMDKGELNPLRNFINSKLKILQEKFKVLTALKKEQEAAGTKTRLLRNVNCISCDKDVVMRKDLDSSMFPKAPALPPSRNMGPYLAYELDQLRKQQKCISSSKNINMFENALQAGKTQKSSDHLCNRYCGGSHTVTTPQQRVTRMGHFLEQWGPEIAPVQDTMVKGTDGKMYKGRDDEQLKGLAAEKPPSRLVEERPAVHISSVKKDGGMDESTRLSKPAQAAVEAKETAAKPQVKASKELSKPSQLGVESSTRSLKSPLAAKSGQSVADQSVSAQNVRSSQLRKSGTKPEPIEEEGEEA